MIIFSNKLKTEDIPYIKKYCKEERLDSENLENEENNKYIIAKINEKIIGFGRIKIYDRTIYELCSVVVDKEFRNQGIGKQMLEKLLANISESVYLMTEDTNIPFYKKLDFEVSGKIPLALKKKFTFCVDYFKEYRIVLMCKKN
jgi:N-acetylglutamate synthase-like GNAT family acetyltransferase